MVTVYRTPPPDFNPTLTISVAYVDYRGQYLFLLRNDEIPQPNTWALPGGKHEAGETALEAMVRELKEETGIEASPDVLRAGVIDYVKYPDFDFICHFFHLTVDALPEITLAPREHKDYRFLSLEDALALPLIPGFEKHLRNEQLP